MRPTALPLLIALAAATLASGCATRQSMDDAYNDSLTNWQGASEESLRARWGKPAAEDETPSGKWITYIVDNPAGAGGGPRISIGIGGFGGGGRVGVGGGVTTPITGIGGNQATTCTTRFLIENGKVSNWTFDGAGCGATG